MGRSPLVSCIYTLRSSLQPGVIDILEGLEVILVNADILASITEERHLAVLVPKAPTSFGMANPAAFYVLPEGLQMAQVPYHFWSARSARKASNFPTSMYHTISLYYVSSSLARPSLSFIKDPTA